MVLVIGRIELIVITANHEAGIAPIANNGPNISAIPASWFAVITINSILPITSTNIFLLPYGIDRKSTVHAVTWTTLVCVPIVVGLIMFFGIYFQ